MRPSEHPANGVVSLIAVFTVGILALSASLGVAAGSLSELAKNRNASAGDEAFYAAEAGLWEGTYQFIYATTSYAGGEPQLINAVSDGEITMTPLSWPYYRVRSAVSSATTNRSVARTITVFPAGEAFKYAIYTNGDLELAGNAAVTGNVFSNGNIEFTGASAGIEGSGYAAGSISDPDNIDGSSIPGVEPLPPPEIDPEPYRLEAETAGTAFYSANTGEAYLNNKTRTAIVYIDDVASETKLNSNTELTGALVVTGDLELTGGTYTASDNHAAVVVYGDLKVSGGTVINGILYVEGAATFGAGNNEVNGALIAYGGATDLTGSTQITYDPSKADLWPDLVGLEKATADDPEVVSWTEE